MWGQLHTGFIILLHSSTQYIRLKINRDLPEKFTVEFDAHFSEIAGGYPSLYDLLPRGVYPTTRSSQMFFRWA